MKAELSAARQQARDDPAWLRTFWPIWLAVLAVGFAVAETVAIVSPGKGGTLTERIKRWLGVDPPAPRRRAASVAFVVALAGFAIWFGPHIVASWPWER